MSGATILASALKSQGITHVFGVVGIPVIELAVALQNEGINYFGFRNEQSASYAASAIGYLTGKPGVCLVVSGPGLVHAVAGLINACENCWPMILIAGSADQSLHGRGAFQESSQMEMCRPFAKSTYQIDSVQRIPFYVEKAVRDSIYGRPGGVYIDFPGNLVNAALASEEDLEICRPIPPAPVCYPNPQDVLHAWKLLSNAQRPLVIVGKGAAYSRAEENVRAFVDLTGIPFLATPMGKGVVSDFHSLCVNKARTTALQRADAILLLGCRLNWMLHFGLPPRFAETVHLIQMDIRSEEMGNNQAQRNANSHSVFLLCDIRCGMESLSSLAKPSPDKASSWQQWHSELTSAGKDNEQKIASKLQVDNPMNYYSLFQEVVRHIDDRWIIVSEGANTMDIGRTMLLNAAPRHRLDAGTYGTMGVGLGFAIAAASHCLESNNGERVLCVEGDSAIGFSLAELETMTRYKLPVLILVVNNSGIYSGLDAESWATLTSALPVEQLAKSVPPTSLGDATRYDLVMSGLGGRGWFVTNRSELANAMREAVRTVKTKSVPCLINALIDTGASRKEQAFDWLTRAKL